MVISVKKNGVFMKKKFALVLFTALLFFGAQMSAFSNEPVMGLIYKEVSQPGGGSGSVHPSKVGCAECVSYFGIIARGNCSIAQAMKNGKISCLSHYDEEVLNILGYKKVIVKAYGQ